MNFNEKLIKLRKEKGISQEELGYELDVTRQTISKWELGQTTPEMDKLIEISKFFDIDVDSLIKTETVDNTDEISEDTNVEEKAKNKKIVWTIVIILLALILIFIYIVSSKIIKFKNNFFDSVFGGKEQSIIENVKDMVSSQFVEEFNYTFDKYQGTEMGSSVFELLDKVIKNNKTNSDRIITVKVLEEETSNPDEIKHLKRSFDEFAKYEISFEYNDQGYIYEAIIEELESQNIDQNNFMEMSEQMAKNVFQDVMSGFDQ